jgi:valyl-tRNA synthetase
VKIQEAGEKVASAIAIAVGEIEIYLIGAVDSAKEKERLTKERAKLEKLIAAQSGKLANQEFISRAPQTIVAAERDKLVNYQTELEKIITIISGL